MSDLELHPNPTALSFPRVKKRSLLVAVAFRSRPVLIRLLGRRRVLTMLLQVSRVLSRLAWETAGEYFGDGYFAAAHALSPAVLQDWVPAGAAVVDIGCGRGRVSRLVAGRAGSVLGLDVEPAQIAAAELAQHPPNVTFAVGDARHVSGKFDVAIMSHILGYFDDPDALLRDVHETAPLLIIEVPDIRGDALNIARISLHLDFSTDAGYVREYSAEVLADELQRTGWHPLGWAHGYGSLGVLASSDRRSGGSDSGQGS